MDILYAIYLYIATALLFVFLAFVALILQIFIGKSIKNPKYPPVAGTVFDQVFYFNKLYDYQTKLAGKYHTFRLLAPGQSEIYTTDTRNIEHILKPTLICTPKDLLMRCTLDSIFRVGFGVDLNCLEGSSQKGSLFIKAFDDSNALVYWRYVDPFWKLKRFLNIGSEASLKKNIKIIFEFVDELIQTRREQLEMQQNCNDKEDILSRFLMESKKDPEKMNDQYLRDIILNFMIAGKDTTASTLSWFFHMLCKNPIIQERIAQEIIEVFSNQAGNEDGTSSIGDIVKKLNDEILEKMHYLHAALTETLRLYPAVPMDGRIAEKDDILPYCFRLKKGDGVYYMSYAMGRMIDIWGDDAHDFRPETWLNNGFFRPKSPFKFIAFHVCDIIYQFIL
ncbi:unnamed protein product [Ilex paraguariensis]|uniref:Cytochrome P450 n=1 Tax=Ilex paraguariensis TaxID=185542 RepID=A0ABC8UZH7_9AQUA